MILLAHFGAIGVAVPPVQEAPLCADTQQILDSTECPALFWTNSKLCCTGYLAMLKGWEDFCPNPIRVVDIQPFTQGCNCCYFTGAENPADW